MTTARTPAGRCRSHRHAAAPLLAAVLVLGAGAAGAAVLTGPVPTARAQDRPAAAAPLHDAGAREAGAHDAGARDAGGRAQVPVRPGREQARAWLLSELAHDEYARARPGLTTRILLWLRDQLAKVRYTGDLPWRLLLAVLTGVLVLLAGLAAARGGAFRGRSRLRRAEPLVDPARSAAQYRQAADAAGADRDWETAVTERFRAIARELEERAVLAPAPGRTADELAREAARPLPELADALLAAARRFDDVRYGGRRAAAGDDATLRELDAAVRRARPELVTVGGGGAGSDPVAPR